MSITRLKANAYRKIIKINDLLKFADQLTDVTDRDKEITTKYVKGEREISLSKEYGLSPERVRQIIERYIRKCSILASRSFLYEWKDNQRKSEEE